jgi:hypothetical protein
MTPPAKPAPQKGGPQTDDRAERLAAALRENLKRRKAQARSQRAREDAPADGVRPGDTAQTGGKTTG